MRIANWLLEPKNAWMSNYEIIIFDTVKISLKQHVDDVLALAASLTFWKYQNGTFLGSLDFKRSDVKILIIFFLFTPPAVRCFPSQNELYRAEEGKARNTTDYNLYLSTWNMYFFFIFSEFEIKYSDLVHKLKLHFSLFRLGGLGTIRYQARQVEYNC